MNDGIKFALNRVLAQASIVVRGEGRSTLRYQDLALASETLNYPILFGQPGVANPSFYRRTRRFISYTAIKREMKLADARNNYGFTMRYAKGCDEIMWDILESVAQKWMFQAVSLVAHDQMVTLQRKHLEHVRAICLDCNYNSMTQ